MKKSPGPASLSNRPSLRTIARSHWLAILIAPATTPATKKLGDGYGGAGDHVPGGAARDGGQNAEAEQDGENQSRKRILLRHGKPLSPPLV